MVFKKGNTYELKAQINNVDIEEITKIVFKFNNIKKTYIADEESEGVIYQGENIFIISLSQQETLSLSDEVEYEVAVKFNDNSVKKSLVYKTSNLKTIIQEVI